MQIRQTRFEQGKLQEVTFITSDPVDSLLFDHRIFYHTSRSLIPWWPCWFLLFGHKNFYHITPGPWCPNYPVDSLLFDQRMLFLGCRSLILPVILFIQCSLISGFSTMAPGVDALVVLSIPWSLIRRFPTLAPEMDAPTAVIPFYALWT